MNIVYPPQPILMVDDDVDLLAAYAMILKNDGITSFRQSSDSREVAGILAEGEYEIAVIDLNMPHVSGRQLLPVFSERCPNVPVIVVTGVDDVTTAVECMKHGAFDYLVKPVRPAQLLASIRRAVGVREMRRENEVLKRLLLSDELRHPKVFDDIITQNRSMHALFQYLEAVADSDQPILITGETGVGKELIAQAVHDLSGRAGQFVPVNVAGLDDTMFSDSLFGHTRGAFTNAVDARAGLIEEARDGTLFLDEIGEMQMTSQVKLLRLLQEREYRSVGSDARKYTNARIVVATNRSIEELRDARTSGGICSSGSGRTMSTSRPCGSGSTICPCWWIISSISPPVVSRNASRPRLGSCSICWGRTRFPAMFASWKAWCTMPSLRIGAACWPSIPSGRPSAST